MHSIRQQDSIRDIVILVLPYVPEDARQALIALGSKIVEIEEVGFHYVEPIVYSTYANDT